MAFDPEDRDEQLLLDHPEMPATRAWSREAVKTNHAPAHAAADSVHARAPAPLEQPAGEHRVVESPALHDDQIPVQEEERGEKPRGFLRRHRFVSLTVLLLIIAAATAGYLYWDYAEHFESTNDAFIAARQFSIAPQVSGYIAAVPVTDNQRVSAGGIIARIDDRNYRIALDQAKAQLAHDQAVLKQARMDLARYQTLLRQKSIAGQQAEDQVYVVQQDEATVAQDQANVDQAQLNLSHTFVRADQTGRVVSLSAAVGQYVQPGTALTMFVPDRNWVTANFKETQLDRMRPGLPVSIHIDAYPERTIGGHVASVQPGSGPAFSLLPPENATGNWVKIVQRVPVKIVTDNSPADVALGPGMSVEATVRVNSDTPLYEQLKALFVERLKGWL